LRGARWEIRPMSGALGQQARCFALDRCQSWSQNSEVTDQKIINIINMYFYTALFRKRTGAFARWLM
jgi:hypothetical protein